MISVMVNPNGHIGEQIKLIRKKKNIRVEDACNKLSLLIGREVPRINWYDYESKEKLHFDRVVAMLTALGIKNIMIDDYKSYG